MNVEAFLKELTFTIASFTEVAAAIIIGFSVLLSFLYYVKNLFIKIKIPTEDIRLNLGKSLALGLEFLLGADILKTVVAPTWQAIGIVAAIAVLRTGLNFFLGKELHDAKKRERDRITD